jgi:predicted membrane channel-forming protein YqfA (hemolysin III family)
MYTIIPIVLFSIIAIIVRIWHWNTIKVIYNYWNLFTSLIILLVGAYFFVKGLDEYDDYLRFNHGIWHMMAAISNYYGLKSTTYERITYY